MARRQVGFGFNPYPQLSQIIYRDLAICKAFGKVALNASWKIAPAI